jgi:type VI secretion system protein ImpH
MLPGQVAINKVRALVRQYVGFEFAWDLRLVLAKEDVPSWSLGHRREANVGCLGRTAWLPMRRGRARTRDADDLVMNVEGIQIEPVQGAPRKRKEETSHE